MSQQGIVDHAPAVSEQVFAGARGSEQAEVRRVTRRRMRDRVTIGQVWRRARGGRRVQVRQVHRADRRVDVVDGAGDKFSLTFGELRRLWRQTDDEALA